MKDKRNRHGAVSKFSSEQRFCKSTAITLISQALHLAQPCLMAGWQGRLADEIQGNYKIFKTDYRLKYLSFCFV